MIARAHQYQNQFICTLFVEQDPIRFNVTCSEIAQVSVERMVTGMWRQGLSLSQQRNDLVEFGNIKPGAMQSAEIFSESRGSYCLILCHSRRISSNISLLEEYLLP